MSSRIQIDFSYAPLSDTLVINQLIKNRISLYPSNDQDIIATYVDLDRIIDAVKFSKGQRLVIDCMMDGYTFKDIADEYGGSAFTYRTLLSRAVKKISDTAKKMWEIFYS